MKTSYCRFSRTPPAERFTVLVFITLLAIMVMLVIANSSALFHLHREIKLLEQRQVARLNASQTNATSVAESPVKPESK